jgi:chromate reductase
MIQTAQPIRIAGISGSLREKSFNTAALRAAIELAPEGVTIEAVGIGDLPLYNDDVRVAGYPATVEAFRTRLAEADAILFVTPEYNYSISGVLKNAIDWASRPPNQPFDGKAVGIMGASPGVIGTARAQYHLRQMLVFLNAYPIN